MKLLFIAHSAELTGGAEDDFVRLLKFFSGKGYILDVLTPNGPRVEEYKKYSNSLLRYSWGFFPINYRNISQYIIYFVKFIIQSVEFHKLINKNQYDLCIVNVSVLLAPLFILKFKKLKSIVFIRETVSPTYFRKVIYKLINRYSEYSFSVSNSITDEYKKFTGKNNITTVYSAIEEEDDFTLRKINILQSIVSKDIYNILTSSNYFKMLIVGGVNELKNQRMLANALIKLKKVKTQKIPIVICAGKIEYDLNYVKGLLNIIDKYSLRDSFFMIGETQKSETLQLFKCSDSMIIASKSEGMPLVLVEAFKFKLPLISTNVGGISEVLKDNVNGILIDNEDELVNAIVKLMNESEFRTKLTNNAFDTYKTHFNLNQNLSIIENIVQSYSV